MVEDLLSLQLVGMQSTQVSSHMIDLEIGNTDELCLSIPYSVDILPAHQN